MKITLIDNRKTTQLWQNIFPLCRRCPLHGISILEEISMFSLNVIEKIGPRHVQIKTRSRIFARYLWLGIKCKCQYFSQIKATTILELLIFSFQANVWRFRNILETTFEQYSVVVKFFYTSIPKITFTIIIFQL